MTLRTGAIAAIVATLAAVAGPAAWAAPAKGVPAKGRALEAAPAPLVLLACDPVGRLAVRLRLVVLNCGRTFAGDDAARVSFATPDGKPCDLPAPGPRPISARVATAGWTGDEAAIVDLGEVSLAPPCPAEVEVRGGLASEPARLLGRLNRAGNPPSVVFTRAWPGQKPPPAGTRKLVFAATVEALDEAQFVVRVACFNCGEHLRKDYDIYLHFEPAPTGQNLDPSIAAGLGPAAQATDASQWGPGEVFVATFGPYPTPRSLPGGMYLRAGLYDRLGGGQRVKIEGPDDTDRALLGRVVVRRGKLRFERACFGAAKVAGTKAEVPHE